MYIKGKCFCGSGKKHNKCHKSIIPDSCIAELILAQKDYDRHVKEERSNSICPEGCVKCCSHYFFIEEKEIQVIVDYIMRTEGKSTLEKYIEKAKEVESIFAKSNTAEYIKLSSDLTGVYQDDGRAAFDDDVSIFNPQQCIFLVNGKCSIYEVRPFICRTYGTTTICNSESSAEIKVPSPSLKDSETRYSRETPQLTNNQRVLERPFPLFYWFSHFMGNPTALDRTLKKLKIAETRSKADFERYKIKGC